MIKYWFEPKGSNMLKVKIAQGQLKVESTLRLGKYIKMLAKS